jgi:hypothetical protein
MLQATAHLSCLPCKELACACCSGDGANGGNESPCSAAGCRDGLGVPCLQGAAVGFRLLYGISL